MKSFRFASALLIAAAMIGTGGRSIADSVKNVVVTNGTPYTLTAFYASPTRSGAGDWSGAANLLAGNTVGPGQTKTIFISDGLTYCHYDLMGILYGITQAAYAYSVNSCDGGSWNITVSP
jgi:hypothetical protein